MPSEALLELRGITKRFPGVLANDDVSLAVASGEVLGLLGENGAGKSTLMHIVSGLIVPDRGEIRVGGQAHAFRSPSDAVAAGVGMVHQHFMLVPTLSVTENVILGDRRPNPVRPRLREHGRRIAAIGEEIGLPVDPEARVSTLDVGQRQRVEIVKALYRDARVLILDEPTTVLTEEERAGLFAMIGRLTASGVAVILISHKLDDIFAVCDRVTVLRGGRVVDAAPLAARTREQLVDAMVGAQIDLPEPLTRRPATGAPLVSVSSLSVRHGSGAVAFKDVSFEVRPGEILALAGVDGNGQAELCDVLAGLRDAEQGTVDFPGLAVKTGFPPLARRRAGIRYVPSDRHASAILADSPLSENHLLTFLFRPAYVRRGVLNRAAPRADTVRILDEFAVRALAPEVHMSTLSGGNQQKLVLGRELDADARFLIAAHPTRGLDIRTIAFIQERLARKRDDGLGVLLVSADLPEIWQVADRVMVLSHRRLFGPKPIAETSLREVGGWMAGH